MKHFGDKCRKSIITGTLIHEIVFITTHSKYLQTCGSFLTGLNNTLNWCVQFKDILESHDKILNGEIYSKGFQKLIVLLLITQLLSEVLSLISDANTVGYSWGLDKSECQMFSILVYKMFINAAVV